MSFQLGDVVRVFGLSNSEWRDRRGVVVEIIESSRGEAPRGQECAVQFFSGERRWFLAEHLVKSIPEKLVRFFRAEVLDRWRQMDPDEAAVLEGDRDGLVKLLRDRYDFSTRRAVAEIDEFLREFNSKLERATAVSSDQGTAPTGGDVNPTPEKTDTAAA